MTSNNTLLKILVWMIQIAVAAVFLYAGYMKLTQPIAELSTIMPWTGDVYAWFVRLIGMVDLIGGTGLLLPSVLRIKPHYAYCAAWSLCGVMVLALLFHLFRGEYDGVGVNVVLFSLLYFIGWARYKKVPIG